MKSLILFLLLVSAIEVQPSSSPVIALAFGKPGESPVSLSVPAQYLAAEIRIESAEDDWGMKLTGIEDARAQLAAATTKENYTLKIERALIFEQRYSKFSFSSSAGGQHDASSDVLILVPINEKSNMIGAMRKIQSIIASLRPAKKVSVSVGSIFLALDNPEQLRGELLKKIRIHVETSAKALFERPSYTISGLEEPLKLRQSGEREIEVYLPFKVNYTEKN